MKIKGKNRCIECNKRIYPKAKRCIKCHNKNRKITPEHRKNTSIAGKRYYELNGTRKLSEDSKEKIRKARAKQITPIKDTKIEVKIQDFLKELNIPFLTHQYMEIEHGYQCDILIPSLNLVIECDGDYWHGNPKKFPNPTEWQLKQIEKDKIRTKELIEEGFKVLRLWESDILTIEKQSVHKTLLEFKGGKSLKEPVNELSN
jgi:G:T-mismatch repair DNA endonuclease (very short patch repair protein)